MTDHPIPEHVRSSALELLEAKVTRDRGPLRHTAIHEAPAQAATFPDGSGSL
jgi:hypothetical protein